jgi:phage terminase large subunit
MTQDKTTVQVNQAYYHLLDNSDRFLLLYGGAGSGKSVFASQKVLLRTIREPGHRILCVRKIAKTIRQSVWEELLGRVAEMGLDDHFKANKSEMTLRFLPNGNDILCCGMDDQNKLKSIKGITSTWLEEPTELLSIDLEQINLRMRGQTPHYKQHLLSFNPVSARHWIREELCKGDRDDVTLFHSTYRDNAFIDEEYVRGVLQKLTGNSRKVYLEGKWGLLEGTIYNPPLFTQYPKTFQDSCYGLDFGFNNPTALHRYDIHDQEPYVTELIYARGLTNTDLIAEMDRLQISKTVPIYADSAEPDRIEEIRRAGYNIKAARKGPGSVNAGISFCQSLPIHSKPENKRFNEEIDGYVWEIDRDGKQTEEPSKNADHAMDAMRYALFSHLGKPAGKVEVGVFQGVGQW